MKTLNILLITGSLAAVALGQPLPRYQVTDLGTLGGSYSFAYSINNNSVITGGSATPSQKNGFAQTAFVWSRGHITSLGTLGGAACTNCSSQGAAASANGDVAVISDTGLTAPEGEDFCEYGTHLQCVAAIWRSGKLTALPLLPGGYNSEAYWMNSKGEAVGVSENGVHDATCSMPSQVYRYEAVKWSPDGKIHELRPLPGDEVSFAFAISDNGDVVGFSGLCSNVTLPPFLIPAAPHGVLWDKDGTPTLIPALRGVVATIPTGITNQGDVVGNLTYEDGTTHVFLWTKQNGMQGLGAPDGDFISVTPCCNNINSRGHIAAFSCPGPQGNCRAILYTNYKWYDLNDLTLKGSPYLTGVSGINEAGQIAGGGVSSTGDPRGFLVSPAQTKAVAAPNDVTIVSKPIQLDGTQSTSGDGKPLTYVWTIPQGYPSAAISGGTSATPTVQFSLTRGTYKFQLTVIDSNGATSTDSVTVNFMGN